MEVKIRDKIRKDTLMSVFLKYMILFCINSIIVLGIVCAVFYAFMYYGYFLPANYMEMQLKEKTETIRSARKVTSQVIPDGCSYGVFEKDGQWLYGDVPQKEQENMWQHYGERNIYASGEYYRFIERENQEVCIVKYTIAMRYRTRMLNHILPRPELLGVMAFVGLFLTQAIILARRFSEKLKKQLKQLNEATQMISENNLDFTVGQSDLKEVNEVLVSLEQMKDALQQSLEKQWDMEEEQKRQLRALSHDIKSPLTIIRGNVELLAEETIEEKGAFDERIHLAQKNILKNIDEIEHYIEGVRTILKDGNLEVKETCVTCEKMQEELVIQAKQLAAAGNMPIVIQKCEPCGMIQADMEQMKRAWNNLIVNGMEYTDVKKGIVIAVTQEVYKEKLYLAACVSDYGAGFLKEELEYVTKEFYRGDKSRHDRSHQGLGLAIAKQLAENQGGFLKLQNSQKTKGGEVTLWMAKK